MFRVIECDDNVTHEDVERIRKFMATQYGLGLVEFSEDLKTTLELASGALLSHTLFDVGDRSYCVERTVSISANKTSLDIADVWEHYSGEIMKPFVPIAVTTCGKPIFVYINEDDTVYTTVTDRGVNDDCEIAPNLKDFFGMLRQCSVTMLDVGEAVKPMIEEMMDFTQLSYGLTPENIKRSSVGTLNSIRQFFGLQLREHNLIEPLPLGIYKRIADVPQSKVAGEMIYVPPGLERSFRVYINLLKEHQHIVNRLVKDVLIPYRDYLVSLNADRSRLMSAAVTKEASSFDQFDVEKVQEQFARLFSKSQQEKRKYGEMIASATEWPALINDYNQMVEATKATTRDEVLAITGQISSVLDDIIGHMQSDSVASSGLRRNQAKVLMNASYIVAANVDYYAVHVGNLLVLGNVLKRAADMVNKSGGSTVNNMKRTARDFEQALMQKLGQRVI